MKRTLALSAVLVLILAGMLRRRTEPDVAWAFREDDDGLVTFA